MESPDTLVQGAPGFEPAPAHAPRGRITARHREEATGLVLDRYQLLEQLGRGGFGVVWRARDELLHREVALKRVWLGSQNDSERAVREAHAAARLSHPAIVALYEACAHEGAFYLISELIDGDTLARLIAEDALDDEEVLEIGLALTSALAHAHARGVIHRDIKPQNVLVPAPSAAAPGAPALQAAAKLTDFGGASLVGEDVLTRTGDVIGTLAYMAPEQSEGCEVGIESDLYSLALVLYEALSGVNPVRAATPAATARRIGQALPPLERARRGLPPALTTALDRALAVDPGRRGSVGELHDALEHAVPAAERPRRRATHPSPMLPRRAPVAAAAVSPGVPTAEGDAREQERPGEADRRRPLGRAVWLVLALALVAWQALGGHPGVSLLCCAALIPVIALAGERTLARAGVRWLGCAAAPALGYLGLAAGFPALAGQASRWRERAALGALGFWWLRLAEPLLAHKLWLGVPAGAPARGVWEGSLSVAFTHVLSPLLTLGVLLGALLWGLGATVLPWLVRGRSAIRDVLAAGAWAALLALASPGLDAGLDAHGAHAQPRGLLAGTMLSALLAVGARAVRGPV